MKHGSLLYKLCIKKHKTNDIKTSKIFNFLIKIPPFIKNM